MRFVTLLVTLVAMLFLIGILNDELVGLPSLQILFSAGFIVGVYAVSGHRRVLSVGSVIAVVALTTTWWRQLSAQPSAALAITNYAVEALFFGFVAWVILRAVLQETRVTADTVYGGISVYLLLGMVWAVFYAAIEFFAPGSFVLGEVSLAQRTGAAGSTALFQELIYFSFVTLTTLGYGDIRPTTGLARVISTSEAVMGQLFVAVFIARLVALQLIHGSRGDA